MFHPTRAIFLLFFLLGASALAMGCTPSIGDKCTSSTDCSIQGDRLCDTTQPGGYCTVFNCEPDRCPSEAQCVAFDQQIDPACYDPQNWARFERTFCMKRCDGDSDCRGGYTCFDLSTQSNPWGASVVDNNPSGLKICMSASAGTALPPNTDGDVPAVCLPYDGGFPDVGTGTDSGSVDSGSVDSGSVDSGSVDSAVDASSDVANDSVSQPD